MMIALFVAMFIAWAGTLFLLYQQMQQTEHWRDAYESTRDALIRERLR